MPEQILAILETHASGAKPMTERMPKIVHADHRQARATPSSPPCVMVEAL
jgi:hypothetical protein